MVIRVASLIALAATCARAAQAAPVELGVSEAVDRALTQNALMAVRAAELAAAQAEAKGAGRPAPLRLSLSPATVIEQLEAAVSQVLGISGTRKWAPRAARHELAATVAGKLLPEMFATVRVRVGEVAEALGVPHDAVQREDDEPYVFVIERSGRYVRRDVVTGLRAGGWVEIKEGLAAGETIVVAGAFLLKSELHKGEMEHEH